MRNVPSQPVGSAFIVAIAAAFLTSCARDRVPYLTVEQQTDTIRSSGTTPVTIRCKAPATRIGGGFLVTRDNRNEGLVVRSSRPSDDNGWIVEVENTTPVSNDGTTVMALAYCLERADRSPTVTIATMGSAIPIGPRQQKQILKAPCPPGTILTGGGFHIDGPLGKTDADYNAGVQESSPEPSNWYLEIAQWFSTGGTRLYRAFAVCASPPLQAGTVVTEDYAGAQPYATFEATCDDASFTTAGGFRLKKSAHDSSGNDAGQDVGRAYESAATSQFKEWTVTTNTLKFAADSPVAVALCLPKL